MTYTNQTVNVRLPESLFQKLQHVATVTHRSMEDVLVTTVDAALPLTPDIPTDMAYDLAAMLLFNDESLKAAAQSSLSPAQQKRLKQLAQAGGERSLTEAESDELKSLLDLHDRAVLRRAKALAILAQRGYDIDKAGQWSLTMGDE